MNDGQYSIKGKTGIFVGCLLFFAGTLGLFRNEGNYYSSEQAIREAQRVVVNVDNVQSLDPALNGKLIHASAFADVKEALTDGDFGVSVKAIALKRNVAYLQWVEESKTENNQTEYTYKRAWTPEPVNSVLFNANIDASIVSNFLRNNKGGGYENFTLFEVENRERVADHVTFGAYRLPPFLVKSIGGTVPAEIQLTAQQVRAWNARVEKSVNDKGLDYPAAYNYFHVTGNVARIGTFASSTEIGDVRITMTKIMPADVSIIAKVKNGTFEEFVAKNGKKISWLAMGTVSSEQMLSKALTHNVAWGWLERVAGLLSVIFGLKFMFRILPALFKGLPLVGNIVDAGVFLFCSVFGFVWSLLAIAVAWLFYRPPVALLLMVAVVGGIGLLQMIGEKRAKKAKEPKAPRKQKVSDTMSWICPKCNALYQGESCDWCGEEKIIND
jgi:hypothetical protein